ncbi:MAG: vWA domain-containing protein [Candidatus Paceibacterota bacterium]|jgi:hypothetical protein
MFFKTKNFQTGQTMILTVMVLNGVLLSVAIIAALLMSYQVHSAGDFANTNKAIFAADAGTDWWLYNYYKNPDLTTPIFTNGSSFSITTSSPPPQAKVIGLAGSSKRAFLATIFLSTCNPDLVLVMEKERDTISGAAERTTYKNAIHNFAVGVFASSSHVYIGGLSYANTTVTDFPLSGVSSTVDTGIITNFNLGDFPNTQINLANAIDGATTHLLSNGRPGTQGTILIITGQRPSPPANYPALMAAAKIKADFAKANQIRVMAVKVGVDGGYYTNLQDNIVTTSSDLFLANNFNGLSSLLTNTVVHELFSPCFTP